MKRYLINSILIALSIVITACYSDSTVEDINPGTPLEYKWGTNPETIKQGLGYYELTADGNIMYVENYMIYCKIAYEFDNNGLCTISLVGPKSRMSDEYIQSLKEGYTEIGDYDEGKAVYTNAAENRLMEITTTIVEGIEYYAIGWSSID